MPFLQLHTWYLKLREDGLSTLPAPHALVIFLCTGLGPVFWIVRCSQAQKTYWKPENESLSYLREALVCLGLRHQESSGANSGFLLREVQVTSIASPVPKMSLFSSRGSRRLPGQGSSSLVRQPKDFGAQQSSFSLKQTLCPGLWAAGLGSNLHPRGT